MPERADQHAFGARACANDGRRTFRRRHRLSRDRDYRAVFNARLRKGAGPLTLWARPNGLEHPRLGLSIGRRVGGATVRNRLKRRLREAFRLERAHMPRTSDGCYDVVVSARAHEPLGLDEYRRRLRELVEAAHRTHARRLERSESRGAEPDGERGAASGPGTGPVNGASP